MVDDDATVRAVIAESLAEEGFEVVATASAGEALVALRAAEPFDAFLLDDQMPGLSGRELLDLLRLEGVTTAAILHSGSLVLTEDERVRLHVHRVVSKPARIADLVAALHDAVRADSAWGRPAR